MGMQDGTRVDRVTRSSLVPATVNYCCFKELLKVAITTLRATRKWQFTCCAIRLVGSWTAMITMSMSLDDSSLVIHSPQDGFTQMTIYLPTFALTVSSLISLFILSLLGALVVL